MVRSTSGKNRRLILLAPEFSRVPQTFVDVELNYHRHDALLAEMQKLRGSLYLRDGAIEPWELSHDKRHHSPADQHSWHLLVLAPDGQICGCARYREHAPSVTMSDLCLASSPLATSDKWERILFSAIASEIDLARTQDCAFVEVGGWALTDEFRCTSEAVKIALSAYSLARMLGGCIGITTATVRHSSASILRRIGGSALQADGIELPSYYDPRYKCDMMALRFDSATPNPRYQAWVDGLEALLPFAAVVCASHKKARKQEHYLSRHSGDETLFAKYDVFQTI